MKAFLCRSEPGKAQLRTVTSYFIVWICCNLHRNLTVSNRFFFFSAVKLSYKTILLSGQNKNSSRTNGFLKVFSLLFHFTVLSFLKIFYKIYTEEGLVYGIIEKKERCGS